MSGIICYTQPSPLSISLAVILITGTIISYIPQIVAMVKKRSSEGLSFLMLGLGLLSGFLTLLNTVILYWQKISCCYRLNAAQCLANNLVPEQLAVAPACMLIMYILFLVYYNHTPYDSHKNNISQYLLSMIFFAIVVIVPLFCCTAALVMYYGNFTTDVVMINYAKVLGIISAIAVFVQWVPQLYTTISLSKAGVLSLPMLLLQCPGAYMVVGFQLSSPQSDWSTWAPYMVSGTAQLMLLIIVSYYKFRDRKNYHSPLSERETVSLYPDSDGSEKWGPYP